MPVTDLLITGIKLMFLGMGIVFVFLLLLIATLTLMSRLSEKFSPPETSISATDPAQPHKIPVNTALLAVISAAITKYRAQNSGTQH